MILIPSTLNATSILALVLPLLATPPSNTATSDVPGTLAPLAPPETVDQLEVKFVLAFAAPTQNLFAAKALVENTKKDNDTNTDATNIFCKILCEEIIF